MTAINESPLRILSPGVAPAAEVTATGTNETPTGCSAGAESPVRIPLDTLAKEIDARLDKGEQMLISAGRQLREARERVEAGEAGNITWPDWCKIYLPNKAESTIRLAISFVNGKTDEEAAAAVREHRQKNAAANRKLRERKAAPSRDGAPAAEVAKLMVAKMPEAERIAFLIEQIKALSDPHDFIARVAAEFDAWKPKANKPTGTTPAAERAREKQAERKVRGTALAAPTAAEKQDAPTAAATPLKPAPSVPEPASSPAPKNTAPTATARASDTEIKSSQVYREAVEMLGKEADKASALAFASSVFRRKRSGEAPQSLTEWQQLCWDMRDDVRSVVVRNNSARAV
jgi:hypothetical protein